LAAARQQLQEMEAIKEKMAQAEAEVQKVKDSENSLRKKLENQASGSNTKFQPGTPFSSIIKHFDFSNFETPTKNKEPSEDADEDEEPNNTGAAIMLAMVQEIQKLHKKNREYSWSVNSPGRS